MKQTRKPPRLSTETAPSRPNTLAVIEIGTTSIRMEIAQIGRGGRFNVLEAVQQAVSLGKDAFTKGSFDRETIEECVHALRSFHRLLEEYGVTDPRQITAIATSAAREASNREALLDRIYIATGIEVKIIDEAEVSRFTYHAVRATLEREPFWRKTDTLVVEVGGGSTEVLTFQRGRVGHTQMYRLGSLRLRKMLEDAKVPVARMREIMQSQIDGIVGQIVDGMPRRGRLTVLALGGDARLACAQLAPDSDRRGLVRLPVRSLARLAGDALRLSVDELVQRYGIAYPDAETLGPALLFYLRLARAARLNSLLVGQATLRHGVLVELATAGSWTEEFRKQIIASAIEMGRKFAVDPHHAQYVASLSRSLFRLLHDEHHLDPRYELILHTAALLHEAGQYIGRSSHHKHSMYVIMHSDLFGLGAEDLLLTALVARYHRRALPMPSHEYYASLDRNGRILVSKLAAILRVADALDCGHAQRLSAPDLRIDGSRLVITARETGSLAVEQHRLREKSQMFEQVYGMTAVLQGG